MKLRRGLTTQQIMDLQDEVKTEKEVVAENYLYNQKVKDENRRTKINRKS